MTPSPPKPHDDFQDARDISAPVDPLIVRLFEYWRRKCAGRTMPRRADIDPVEMRALVNNVILFEVVEPISRFRVRLVGQAIIDFVGFNSTGRYAGDDMPPDSAARMIAILADVVARRAPRFRAGFAHWHRDKSYRNFEACFLPLSDDDRTVDKILGGITFATDRPA